MGMIMAGKDYRAGSRRNGRLWVRCLGLYHLLLILVLPGIFVFMNEN